MKTFLCTTFALVAFAFNSILCRLALRTEAIDAVGFTTVRLVSGAVVLGLLYAFFGKKNPEAERGNWPSAFFLFLYAICFSVAYLSLSTAAGALILFGSVQATMMIVALISGERPNRLEWLGLLVALGGLVYLVFPGLSAPPLLYSLLMAAAGAAWGFYTLRGTGKTDPLANTAGNFVRTLPLIALIALPFLSRLHLSRTGVLLAVASGAVASGIGYAVWYAALRYHTRTRAAILQLAVPALAGFGGVVLLAETVSLRLLLASTLILGGIGLAIVGKKVSREQ